MGYYTAYELKWELRGKQDEYVTPENYIRTHDEMNYALSEDGSTAERSKWYEHEEDMKQMSKTLPQYLFTLSGEGEESEDIWKKYFLAGKMQIAKAEIKIEDFDESKLI